MGGVVKSVSKSVKKITKPVSKFFGKSGLIGGLLGGPGGALTGALLGGGLGASLGGNILGSDEGYKLAERQIKMQEDIAEKLKEEMPKAMERAERYGQLGLQQVAQARDVATRMAGRMGALGYSSQAITGALSGIVGETAKAGIPIVRGTQEMLVNIPPLYLRGASSALAGNQGFVNSLQGLQQPSLFDRMLQVSPLIALAA